MESGPRNPLSQCLPKMHPACKQAALIGTLCRRELMITWISQEEHFFTRKIHCLLKVNPGRGDVVTSFLA
jgi:hypothetical protein